MRAGDVSPQVGRLGSPASLSFVVEKMRVVAVTEIRWGGVISQVIAAVICLLGCARSPVPNPAPKAFATNMQPQTAKLPLLLERVVVPLETTSMSTLIHFPSNSPLPWEHGNWFTIEFTKPPVRGQKEERVRWDVVNMHTENFREITRRLKVSSVEVHVLRDNAYPLNVGYAVITDARIPREWYLSEPARVLGHLDLKTANELKAAFPEYFRASD
jgi:hypothetical protein